MRVWAVCMLLLVTQCKTRTISFYVVDKDKLSFSTFDFYAKDTEGLTPRQQTTDSLLQHTITQVLQSNGYRQASPAQVYIAYQLTTGMATNINSTTNYAHNSPYRYNPYPYLYDQPAYRTDYKEGVFIIELYSNQDKLLWQGSQSFKVKPGSETQPLLVSLAHNIMESFTNP